MGQGYEQVYALYGGFQKWIDVGYPVTKPE